MKKSELSLSRLKNMNNSLKVCFADFQAQTDERIKEYIKDSCVQRFEYTYEVAKKIMNKFLKKEYEKSDKELTVNNIFRQMYGLGMVQDFERWANYRECRTFTSHEYDKKNAEQILEIVPDFMKDIDYLISALEKVLTND